MNKLKTFIIITLAILVPGGIAALIFWKCMSDEEESSPAYDLLTGKTNTVPTLTSTQFPLKYAPNKKSELVKQLQKKLNAKLAAMATPLERPHDSKGKMITKLTVDGYFGDQTRAVVKFFLNTDSVTEEQFNSL